MGWWLNGGGWGPQGASLLKSMGNRGRRRGYTKAPNDVLHVGERKERGACYVIGRYTGWNLRGLLVRRRVGQFGGRTGRAGSESSISIDGGQEMKTLMGKRGRKIILAEDCSGRIARVDGRTREGGRPPRKTSTSGANSGRQGSLRGLRGVLEE